MALKRRVVEVYSQGIVRSGRGSGVQSSYCPCCLRTRRVRRAVCLARAPFGVTVAVALFASRPSMPLWSLILCPMLVLRRFADRAKTLLVSFATLSFSSTSSSHLTVSLAAVSVMLQGLLVALVVGVSPGCASMTFWRWLMTW